MKEYVSEKNWNTIGPFLGREVSVLPEVEAVSNHPQSESIGIYSLHD
jgi:hypothetical protein